MIITCRCDARLMFVVRRTIPRDELDRRAAEFGWTRHGRSLRCARCSAAPLPAQRPQELRGFNDHVLADELGVGGG